MQRDGALERTNVYARFRPLIRQELEQQGFACVDIKSGIEAEVTRPGTSQPARCACPDRRGAPALSYPAYRQETYSPVPARSARDPAVPHGDPRRMEGPSPIPSVRAGLRRKFTFDRIFGTTASQEDIFSEVGVPVVQNCIDGSVRPGLIRGQWL
jgi:hypothetical protein